MLKKILTLVLITFLSLNNLQARVTKDYEKLFKSSLISKTAPFSNFSLSMYKKSDSGQWEEVLAHNTGSSEIPASITKVLTAAGMLELHGIHKSIPTELYAKSKPSEGVLRGPLYVKGFGDPSLVSEKLWLLVNELKSWKIKKIEGGVVFDDSNFDRDIMVAGRSKWNQRAYNAYISGLSLNWNSVRVRFLDYSNGIVSVDPYNSYFDLKMTKTPKRSSGVSIKPGKNTEVLRATFGKDAFDEEVSIYRRVTHPRKVFESQFLTLLKNANIQVEGKTEWKKMPEGLEKLGDVKSRPMSNLLKLMMKYSNNFIADSLAKFTFHDQTKQTGSYEKGLVLIREAFKKISDFKKPLVYKSASGLSRENRINVKDMTSLLQNIEKKYYYPEFLSMFPISCIDGTLKNRICKKTGQVRAKTGLLAGVSSLTGFAHSEDGKDEYLFAFIYNGKNGQQFEARNTFDRFLEKLL